MIANLKQEITIQLRSHGFWFLLAGMQIWLAWILLGQLEPYQLGKMANTGALNQSLTDTLIGPFFKVCQQSLLILLPPLGASLISRDFSIGLWKQIQAGRFTPYKWLTHKFLLCLVIAALVTLLCFINIVWLSQLAQLDWLNIFSGLLSIFFLSAVALTSGCLFACWTRQGFSASILAIVFLQLLWISAWATALRGIDSPVMVALSLSGHLDALRIGAPTLADLAYFPLTMALLYAGSLAALFWNKGRR